MTYTLVFINIFKTTKFSFEEFDGIGFVIKSLVSGDKKNLQNYHFEG